jgi:hypothetical protein
MSFLSETIQKVRSNLKNNGSDLKASVNEFRKEIRNKLDELKHDDNLQIYHTTHRDISLGGVLRGNRRSRQRNETKSPCKVLVQKKTFNKTKPDSLEVPYFRAAFNVKDRTLVDASADDSPIRIVAYEAPLMRQKKGRNSRAVSCDLVGLSSENGVTCIEGKVNPLNRATDIVYGLLESYAYGVCVDYYLSDSEHSCRFENELRACCEEFHPGHSNIPTDKALTAAFALAAPESYFNEYFTHPRMTPQKAHRRLEETERLLKTFKTIEKSPTFNGFLICDKPCKLSVFRKDHCSIPSKGEKRCVPNFKDDKLKVTPAFTVHELEKLTVS